MESSRKTTADWNGTPVSDPARIDITQRAGSETGASNMKITEVHAILMSYPLPEPMRLPFWNGERTILKRDAMLIRVKTDTGLTGYAPGPAHERAQKEIHGVIRSFLLGKDPRRWGELNFTGELEITKTYRAVEI